MSKIKLIYLISLIAIMSVVSGCGKIADNQSTVNKKQAENINRATSTDAKIATTTNISTTTSASEINSATATSILASTTEAADTSDWKTYRNEEYEFELKYPKDYEIFQLTGELFGNQEYPEIGKIFKKNIEYNTLTNLDFNINDRGYVFINDTTTLFHDRLIDTRKRKIANIKELVKILNIKNPEIINVGQVKIIKSKVVSALVFYIINPRNNKVISFSTLEMDNSKYVEFDKKRKELLIDIISTIKFF